MQNNFGFRLMMCIKIRNKQLNMALVCYKKHSAYIFTQPDITSFSVYSGATYNMILYI